MVPQGRSQLDSMEGLLIGRLIRWEQQRVETTLTPTSVKYVPRHLFLDKKMIGVKFNNHIIIFGKAIDRAKAFMRLRNMKNFMQTKISTRGMQKAMTNICNIHT